MRPPRSLRRAVLDARSCWTAVLALASLAVPFGSWSLSDLDLVRLWPELPWFALVALSTFVVFGLPVATYRRLGLVAPLGVTGAYVAYFGWFGVSTGAVGTPFVALVYSWIAAPVVVLVVLVEGVVRQHRRGPDEGDGDLTPASP